MRSEAQVSRQGHRARDGRYDRHYPCELCGRSAGRSYCSDPRTNETGIGLILCASCGRAIASMTVERMREVLTRAGGLTPRVRVRYARSLGGGAA